jgi:isoleucyl-tRNA synthetase
MEENMSEKNMYKKVNTWFDIVKLEKDILQFWEKNQVFQKLVKKNQNQPQWSFLDGPITANNPMGVHHAWGRTLKDAYQRYWAMNGRRLRYQNGFDCRGLWVEVEVEKELNFKSKKDIDLIFPWRHLLMKMACLSMVLVGLPGNPPQKQPNL